MRYAAQRLVQFVLVFVVVTFIVMVATRIGSDDPARDLAGGLVSDAQIEQVKQDYPYLDKPLVVQYGYWLKDFVTGEWGKSYAASETVVDMFQQRMPSTAFIAFWAVVLGLLIAVPIGVYAAYRRDRAFDRVSGFSSFGVISMPPLVIAVLLLYLVVVRYGVFPTVGRSRYVAPWDNPIEHFKNFFIPALTLGLGLGAVWSRLLRADMILTLQSDAVMMARAKGISPQRVLWVHALRASILSLMTSVALQMSALLGGAVVAEQFFGPKGLGERLLIALQQNDLLIIQAITAIITVFVVFANFLVDLLYAVVDPRIRLARTLG
ncbi:MAG: ABC transporter permease [Acidimicrobiia bacterium]|nr:ABC transporter permease [Acidimicrobiia bacterium]